MNAAGNGGWLDIGTGEIRVAGMGDINLQGNVKNKVNWAPRLGVTYQINVQDRDPRRAMGAATTSASSGRPSATP